MPPKRSHILAIAALVTTATVAAWIGLGDHPDPPVRTGSSREGAPRSAVPTPQASDEHATRLQGRPEALESQEAGRAGTTSPGAGALPPADPAPPCLAPPPPTSNAAEPARVGPFPSAGVSPTGELVFGRTPWTTVAVREGYALVCYHLGALAPTPPRLLPALQGVPEASPEPQAEPDPWWAELAAALVEAVGRDHWPEADTLLAWKAEQAALYVQQDADGHARVTELLAQRAAGRLGTLQVVLELAPSPAGPGDRVRVDVPWGRTVRAHRGSVWAFLAARPAQHNVSFLADFDVEIACEPLFAIKPTFVGGLDTGTAVSARRVETGDGSGVIEVEVATSRGQPRFEPGEVTPKVSKVPIPIEVPQLDVARWRGRVPARPGKHHVELDDGRSATLVVHASEPGPRPAPPFVAHVLAPRRPSPSTSRARSPRSIVVTWLVPGPLQGRTMTVPLVGHGDSRDGPPATGTCTVDTQGRAVDPDRDCPWPLAEGGIRIHATVVTAGGIDVVDLVVERCDAAFDERPSAPLLREDWTHGEYRTWHEPLSLPICRVRVDARRLYVPVGEEVSVRPDDDTGATFRVELPREE